MSKNLNLFKEILNSENLPSHNDLFSAAEKVSSLLENEVCNYRPAASGGMPGSLLDFRASALPFIVIPDLHARPHFLFDILSYKLPAGFCDSAALTVIDALEKGLVNLIFLGDALHTERTTKQRWAEIQMEFDSGNCTGPKIQLEMTEGLNLLLALMQLKIIFPEHFHYLKGNHENITNRTGKGDFSFVKYADEGRMGCEFIREYYGDDVLYMIHCVEEALPLIAVNSNCIVSHAEPRECFSKEQLINAREDSFVIEGLTWTDNDEAAAGSADYIINQFAQDNLSAENYVYLGGHRPVPAKYLERQDGKFVQIHNPLMQNIAIVRTDRKFNPEIDIVEV